ncbi:MAG: ketopantoate reductase C-terminal domain-containing protein, partial [Candidatus Promineifilaceae bacterium]|nr:ketopantoate reductase C-terminal domain-containing protein [Candidatus Promineifilaceae bacterium]
GRQTEIEAITGAVVRSADKHAVPAPVNAALLRLFQRVAAGEGWQEVIPSLQPDVQPLFAALSGSE